MRLLRKLRARKFIAPVLEQKSFYAQTRSPAAIREWQLQAFNELWPRMVERIPFWKSLAEQTGVARCFSSWDELQRLVPIMDRAMIRSQGAALTDTSRPPDFIRTTGGSTAEPLKFPGWNSDLEPMNADFWFARDWYGISGADRLFLFWGHSHQLGAGVVGKINAFRRNLKDALLGYHRFSAYDLSPGAMRRAADEMLRFKPSWIVAYSTALDRFATANSDRATQFHGLKLKAAIATSEGFPHPNCSQKIQRILGCPVVMEYGSVETGPVAYQQPNGRFLAFWRHWFLEGTPSQDLPGANELLLTSLYPRCLPLIRYRIGDLISEDPNSPNFAQTFDRVIGRCNDAISLADGTIVHSEAFAHVLKESDFTDAFQVVQEPTGLIDFRYVATTPPTADDLDGVRKRLAVVHPLLSHVSLTQVDALSQTIAGKTKRVISLTNKTSQHRP